MQSSLLFQSDIIDAESIIQMRLAQHERHIREDYDYCLEMEGMATPRPRFRVVKPKSGPEFVHVYHPAEYDKYVAEIRNRCRGANVNIGTKVLEQGEYGAIFATFWFPYPKSTPKKHLIDGALYRKKPDWDNLIKGLQDALTTDDKKGWAGVILSDAALHDGCVAKRYTTRENGFIKFNLY